MRIRKHAKVSPLLYTSSPPQNGVVLQSTTICQLNQSPWDVITFSPQEYSSSSYPPPPPPPLRPRQVGEDEEEEEEEEEGSLPGGNGSFCDSIGASESAIHDQEMEEEDDKFCERIDGKGWQCHRKAQSGETFCDHHKSMEQTRRGRPKKGSTSSYPNGYYYYTGFGPRWGKRRGANHEPTTTDSPIIDPELDYMEEEEEDDDDEEEEEEEDGGNGKKRARKPIKARSLKSLM